MYFDTSKDLLLFVLTIAVAVLTVFLVWFLYYLISILRRADRTVKDVQDAFSKIHAILDTVQEAAAQSTAHLSLIVGVIKRLMAFAPKRRRQDTDAAPASRSAKGKNRSAG